MQVEENFLKNNAPQVILMHHKETKQLNLKSLFLTGFENLFWEEAFNGKTGKPLKKCRLGIACVPYLYFPMCPRLLKAVKILNVLALYPQLPVCLGFFLTCLSHGVQ